MKTFRQIIALIAMLVLLTLLVVGLNQRSEVASAYPPPSTPSVPTTHKTDLPTVATNYKFAPVSTNSWYIVQDNRTLLYNRGYSDGYNGTSGFVILDFGNVGISGSQYGTFLPTGHGFVSTSEIGNLAEGYLDGWWSGYNATNGGATIEPSALITVGIGVNNCGNGGTSTNPDNPCVPGGTNMPSAHGQAWAQMVLATRSYIVTQGYTSKEAAEGATDMEPGWNTAAISSAWVTSYASNAPGTLLLDFGSCDGCSYVRSDGTICTTCTTMTYSNSTTGGVVTWSWNLSDIVYVAWGAPTDWPVPEIYIDGTNARQWYGLSRYVFDTNGSPVRFKGTLTTFHRTGNSPNEGWEQLWIRTYNDPLTRFEDMPWSTDIDFQ